MDSSLDFNTPLKLSHVHYRGYNFDVLRLDLMDSFASGNKLFKLKYNFLKAKEQGINTILTFGGAFSNHIEAMARLGKQYNFNTLGIIRGEEPSHLGPTLKNAQLNGMKLFYISREDYRHKNIETIESQLLQSKYLIVPEGGSSKEGIKGASEILTGISEGYDYVATAVGTGGTLSGLIESGYKASFLGFSSLKGAFSLNQIVKEQISSHSVSFNIIHDYHFGGYAKTTEPLLLFMKDFYSETGIKTDPVYTGKLFFGLYDSLREGKISPDKRILVIHTGGLQGIEGFEWRWNCKLYD